TAGSASAPSEAIVEDLRQIVNRYGKDHVILAGVSENERYPEIYQRYELIFRGMPIGLDPAGVMEYKLGAGERADLGRFLQGLASIDDRPVLWITPKGSKPFAMLTLYPPRDEIFGEEFRAEFWKEFEWAEQTQWFDIYLPRKDRRQP